ncbi:hypothetical protein AKJ36_00025 [candidate division MSBL1 archaeon SCGC-AAA259I07]|uniref:Uncharacterized protein n=1 Tax=candidate division MSBL1 archaeon SCGC-AAA259I07 TaxID=1698266 RepID=A0A133UMX7_9EURY|nr:hypothetical protein AKJ36_00025 [candidate division MSBL1 archaeon SCGC-AAA259I07]
MAFVLNEPKLKSKLGEDEIPPSGVGEEVAHFLREKVGPGIKEPRYASVGEFFGRLGRRLVADSLDEKVEKPEVWLKWVHSVDGSKEEFRNKLIKKAGNAEPGDILYDVWESVAHYAGYKVADENYPEVLEDENLLYRNSEVLWKEYEMLEKEYEGLEEAVKSFNG